MATPEKKAEGMARANRYSRIVTVLAGFVVLSACRDAAETKLTDGSEDTGGPATDDGFVPSDEGPATDDGSLTTGDDPTTGAADEDPLAEESSGGEEGLETGDEGGGETMCSPSAQDCAEGEKCVIWWNDPLGEAPNVCRPVMGTGQSGDDCVLNADGSDTCDVGLGCEVLSLEEGGSGTGMCLGLCESDADCEATDGICAYWNYCYDTCHPLAPECPDGWVCELTADHGYGCMPDWSGDQGAYGDPCSGLGTCNPGMACLWNGSVDMPGCESQPCCSYYCDLTAEESICEGTEVCVQDLHDPPPEYANVGFCAIPH
jgi:hypothetical protein